MVRYELLLQNGVWSFKIAHSQNVLSFCCICFLLLLLLLLLLLFFLGEMVASVQKTPTWSIVVHNDESQCLIFK